MKSYIVFYDNIYDNGGTVPILIIQLANCGIIEIDSNKPETLRILRYGEEKIWKTDEYLEYCALAIKEIILSLLGKK